MNIKFLFEQFRDIDLEIINSIKSDNENPKLLDERQNIIEQILSTSIDKNELRQIYKNMGLKKLDLEVESQLNKKMLEIKKEIKRIAVNKQATQSYSTIDRSINFFSRSV